MADIGLKEAREIIEKVELVELTLKKTVKHIEIASNKFNHSLIAQEDILRKIPKLTGDINFMKLLISINIAFICGMIVGKYVL